MQKIFFLSYSRSAEKDAEVTNFFNDLLSEVKKSLGVVKAEAFLDAPKLKNGLMFEPAIQSALRDFKVGVVLLSPDYIKPEKHFCFWEFEYLLEKQRTYSIQTRLSKRVMEECELLILLPWLPTPTDEWPLSLNGLQLGGHNLNSRDTTVSWSKIANKLNTDGLQQIFSSRSENSDAYEHLLFNLARKIREQYFIALDLDADFSKDLSPPVPDYDGTKSWEYSQDVEDRKKLAREFDYIEPDEFREFFLSECIKAKRLNRGQISLEFFMLHLVRFLATDKRFKAMVNGPKSIKIFISQMKKHCENETEISAKYAKMFSIIADNYPSLIEAPFNYLDNLRTGDKRIFLHSAAKDAFNKLGCDGERFPRT
jgi:TIR domain